MSSEPNRLFIPALSPLYRRLRPLGYPIMRFATGAILVPHGIEKIMNRSVQTFATTIGAKGLPFELLQAYLVFFTESVAAACLAIGLFTRLAASMVGIQMLVIIVLFQWPNGYFWTNRGYEVPLLWALLCLGIVCRGGGPYSVDRLIGREL